MSAYYCFFPDSYTLKTIHLGWYEDLAYRRLLDLYYSRSKPLPNDRAYLMRAVRATEPEQQAAVDTVLTEFFNLQNDGWHQNRADDELNRIKRASMHAKTAADARWSKNKELADARALPEQSTSNAGAMHEHLLGNATTSTFTSTSTSTSKRKVKTSSSSDDDGFGVFWKEYPRKVGKKAAEKAWAKLKQPAETCKLILAALAWQKQTEQWTSEGGKFIPHPNLYLKEERWQDEPIEKPTFDYTKLRD